MHLPVFDAHLHIIDPAFPLPGNQGYCPPPFRVADYRARLAGWRLRGGAVVAGSFQGTGQAWLSAALRALGPGFVGVAQVPPTIGDTELLALAAVGVRGLRFTLARGASLTPLAMEHLARRVWDLAGLHVELYADGATLGELAPVIRRLPAVCIDHLGLDAAGAHLAVELAAAGVWVKATGFGRLGFDIPATLRAIHGANPAALVFGTDLPSTRAPRPFLDADAGLVIDSLGATAAARVFLDNALDLYRIHPCPTR